MQLRLSQFLAACAMFKMKKNTLSALYFRESGSFIPGSRWLTVTTASLCHCGLEMAQASTARGSKQMTKEEELNKHHI